MTAIQKNKNSKIHILYDVQFTENKNFDFSLCMRGFYKKECVIDSSLPQDILLKEKNICKQCAAIVKKNQTR